MTELWVPDFIEGWIRLDEDVAITTPRKVASRVDPETQQPVEEELSAWWAHRRPDGTNCGLGRISFEPGHHQLESESPYTIVGSLLCVGCQRHGWVRDGKWVPA